MPWCWADSGTCDQVLILVETLPVWKLRPSFCGALSLSDERTGLQICSAITQWSESCITRNHTLLSHLRLLHPGGPGSRIHVYIPQEEGGSVLSPGTGFPLRRSYDSQGYDGGILTFPNLEGKVPVYIYIPQEEDGPVQSQSNVT
jgi:hypothetical protein